MKKLITALVVVDIVLSVAAVITNVGEEYILESILVNNTRRNSKFRVEQEDASKQYDKITSFRSTISLIGLGTLGKTASSQGEYEKSTCLLPYKCDQRAKTFQQRS